MLHVLITFIIIHSTLFCNVSSHLRNLSFLMPEKRKIMHFNRKQMLNFGVFEERGMIAIYVPIKITMHGMDNGGERTFCLIVSKLAFLFQPPFYNFISSHPRPIY